MLGNGENLFMGVQVWQGNAALNDGLMVYDSRRPGTMVIEIPSPRPFRKARWASTEVGRS